MDMEKDVARKLEDFRKSITLIGEDVVFRVFPNKILELHDLIQSTSSASSPYHLSNALNTTDTTVYPPPPEPTHLEEAQPKKRKRVANGSADAIDDASVVASNNMQGARYPQLVHANTHTAKLHEVLKRECEFLADGVDKIKLWVNLTMPQIEDGDNFGVGVQEEVLTELHRAQESAYNLRDSARQDHLNRAKICSKIIKYPNVEDYTLSLKEHDEKQLFYTRQHLIDLRNMYAVLTDLIHKNITKIRAPKAHNSIGLY